MKVIKRGTFENGLLPVLFEMSNEGLIEFQKEIDDETNFLVFGEKLTDVDDVQFVGAIYDHPQCQIITDTMFSDLLKEKHPEYFL